MKSEDLSWENMTREIELPPYEEWKHLAKYEQRYDDLSEKYAISAREYFAILRLAILYIDGENLDTSFKITQYLPNLHDKSELIYECACQLMATLDVFRDKRRGGRQR